MTDPQPTPDEMRAVLWREIGRALEIRQDGLQAHAAFYPGIRRYLETLTDDQLGQFLEHGLPQDDTP